MVEIVTSSNTVSKIQKVSFSFLPLSPFLLFLFLLKKIVKENDQAKNNKNVREKRNKSDRKKRKKPKSLLSVKSDCSTGNSLRMKTGKSFLILFFVFFCNHFVFQEMAGSAMGAFSDSVIFDWLSKWNTNDMLMKYAAENVTKKNDFSFFLSFFFTAFLPVFLFCYAPLFFLTFCCFLTFFISVHTVMCRLLCSDLCTWDWR